MTILESHSDIQSKTGEAILLELAQESDVQQTGCSLKGMGAAKEQSEE